MKKIDQFNENLNEDDFDLGVAIISDIEGDIDNIDEDDVKEYLESIIKYCKDRLIEY